VSWKLKRTKQCAKCPWKVSTNPHDIPDGYSADAHRALAHTIAKPGDLSAVFSKKPQIAFACHETNDAHCIGWIRHQVGRGNNIALRLQMMTCENRDEMQTFGEQHETFDDTLPK
jgi:hypothetical protein